MKIKYNFHFENELFNANLMFLTNATSQTIRAHN